MLVYEAATLARQIRRNPSKLTEFDYPPRMELAVTCCCHIVIDDSNHSDDCVAFCIMLAARLEHADCLALALMLARASLTQRKRIRHLASFWLPPGMDSWR